MPAEKAARQIATAVTRRRRERVITGHGKAAVFLQRHVPWLLSSLIRLARIRRRQHLGPGARSSSVEDVTRRD